MQLRGRVGLAALLLMAVMLAGCLPFGQMGKGRTPEQILRDALLNSVEFDLQSFSPDIDITPQGLFELPKIDLVFNVEIGVTNNSAIPLLAKAADVRLFTRQTEFTEAELNADDALATASVTKDLAIPKGEMVTVPLRIKAPVEKVGMELVNLINSGDLFYRIDALIDFTYEGFTLPYQVVLDEGGNS